MAVEAKRGCGYRKVGGTYLVGGGIGVPCDRLPFLLEDCKHCKDLGVRCALRQSRGWEWVNVGALFQGEHVIERLAIAPGYKKLCPEADDRSCRLCTNPGSIGRAGIIWIGTQFYKTPDEFVAEGVSQGFSRRIAAMPRGFVVGETWVLLAHPKAVPVTESVASDQPQIPGTEQEIKFKPGIFYVWKPQRVERICPESWRGSAEIDDLEKRGITPVFVPDEDKDHQGSVYDKEDEPESYEDQPLFAVADK